MDAQDEQDRENELKADFSGSESHPVYPVHPCEVGFQIL